ncbi:MAG: hypothetical protein ACTSV1_04725 [Alphaproteobacteria bacterium]
MAEPEKSQRRMPSQEKLLLDYIQRLDEHRENRKVVHLHLSSLKPYNRRENHILAAVNGFENLVQGMFGQLFTLNNSDLFFFFKDVAMTQTETVVQKVRFLFSDDPLLEDEAPGENRFSTWYDAEEQFEEVLKVVQGIIKAEAATKSKKQTRMDARSALKMRQKEGDPMTPEILDRLETALERADLSNLMRRQFICAIDRQMIPEPSFSEMFISIADLRETLIPGTNLLSNRWLFQHLTEALDLRVLSLLLKSDAVAISGDISFNANVATLLSKEFQDFDDNIAASKRGSMIIELQNVDVISDLGAFLFAREYVQDKGYRVCLDGLTYETISMMNRERLGVDLVKLMWDPAMADGGTVLHDSIRSMVKKAGPSRVIMCRVDNREATDFGHSVGIGLFQGHFVENLIAEDNRRRELLRLKRRMERSEEEDEEDELF